MIFKKFLFFMVFIVMVSSLSASYFERQLNLRGNWFFMIGDDASFADMHYDDSEWTRIRVPDNWEEEGFPGYDGYAWYRVRFKIPRHLEGESLYIRLGRIDDVDETFLNGKRIGQTGSFEPDYETKYSEERLYYMPENLLRINEENVIAVRVYDAEGSGGILSGNIGIYSKRSPLLLIQFSPDWKFSPGDDPEWSDRDYNDSDWDEIEVPAAWEEQGYKLHDGYAWYRKKVTIPSDIPGGHLVLFLGKIDDDDEVYFNGKLIGHTGNIDSRNSGWNNWDNWKKERFYYLPKSLIKPGQKNVIAIRIYDRHGQGGLYDDSPGLLTQQAYLSYKRARRSTEDSFGEIIEKIIEAIFN